MQAHWNNYDQHPDHIYTWLILIGSSWKITDMSKVVWYEKYSTWTCGESLHDPGNSSHRTQCTSSALAQHNQCRVACPAISLCVCQWSRHKYKHNEHVFVRKYSSWSNRKTVKYTMSIHRFVMIQFYAAKKKNLAFQLEVVNEFEQFHSIVVHG